jgi:hypothetical protein
MPTLADLKGGSGVGTPIFVRKFCQNGVKIPPPPFENQNYWWTLPLEKYLDSPSVLLQLMALRSRNHFDFSPTENPIPSQLHLRLLSTKIIFLTVKINVKLKRFQNNVADSV